MRASYNFHLANSESSFVRDKKGFYVESLLTYLLENIKLLPYFMNASQLHLKVSQQG
jgi:hypothetical protein